MYGLKKWIWIQTCVHNLDRERNSILNQWVYIIWQVPLAKKSISVLWPSSKGQASYWCPKVGQVLRRIRGSCDTTVHGIYSYRKQRRGRLTFKLVIIRHFMISHAQICRNRPVFPGNRGRGERNRSGGHVYERLLCCGEASKQSEQPFEINEWGWAQLTAPWPRKWIQQSRKSTPSLGRESGTNTEAMAVTTISTFSLRFVFTWHCEGWFSV